MYCTKQSIKINVKTLQKIQGKLTFTAITNPLRRPLLGTLDHIIAAAETKKKITCHRQKINQKLLSHMVWNHTPHAKKTITCTIIYTI